MFSNLVFYIIISNLSIIFCTLGSVCDENEDYDIQKDELAYRRGFYLFAINTFIILMVGLYGWNF